MIHQDYVTVASHQFKMVPSTQETDFVGIVFQLLHPVLVIFQVLRLREIVRCILKEIVGLCYACIVMREAVVDCVAGTPGPVIIGFDSIAFPRIHSIVGGAALGCPQPFGVNIKVAVNVGADFLHVFKTTELIVGGLVGIFRLFEKIAGTQAGNQGCRKSHIFHYIVHMTRIRM